MLVNTNHFSAVLLLLLISGCARQPPNPSFNVSNADAKRALKAMAKEQKPLERPVVVLGGYQDLGIGPAAFVGTLREAVGRDRRMISVVYPFSGSFDECRREVVEAVEKKFPSSDASETVEVDAIGLSMGGIVARYAATERPGEKRLRIRRLFTISTPHRGAVRADLPTMSQLHRDLRRRFELPARAGGRRGRAARLRNHPVRSPGRFHRRRGERRAARDAGGVLGAQPGAELRALGRAAGRPHSRRHRPPPARRNAVHQRVAYHAANPLSGATSCPSPRTAIPSGS